MQAETFIPGKDAALESTIATMQQKLGERGFLEPLGPDMEGSAMHQTLLAAYDKLFAESAT